MLTLRSVISSTIGLISPRYKTLGQWIQIYNQILDSKQIKDNTRDNRRAFIHHIVRELGEDKIVSQIKPHEVSMTDMYNDDRDLRYNNFKTVPV